jgi:hypothetical protein
MLLSDLGQICQSEQRANKQPTPERGIKELMYSGFLVFSTANKCISLVNSRKYLSCSRHMEIIKAHNFTK